MEVTGCKWGYTLLVMQARSNGDDVLWMSLTLLVKALNLEFTVISLTSLF